MLGLRSLVRVAARSGARREFQSSTVAALAKRECRACLACLPLACQCDLMRAWSIDSWPLCFDVPLQPPRRRRHPAATRSS